MHALRRRSRLASHQVSKWLQTKNAVETIFFSRARTRKLTVSDHVSRGRTGRAESQHSKAVSLFDVLLFAVLPPPRANVFVAPQQALLHLCLWATRLCNAAVTGLRGPRCQILLTFNLQDAAIVGDRRCDGRPHPARLCDRCQLRSRRRVRGCAGARVSAAAGALAARVAAHVPDTLP
jgi:hypothetical protein